MVQKLIGYLLLMLGLFVMLICLSNIYGLYAKNIETVSFFDLDAIVLKNNISLDNFPENVRPLLQKSINETPPMVLMNKKDINDTTNFFAHIFLVGFIMNGGYLFAKIGTKMIREVHINVDMPQKLNQTV